MIRFLIQKIRFIIWVGVIFRHVTANAIDINSAQILYTGNYLTNTISAYIINPQSGILVPLDIGLVKSSIEPADITILDGKFLYTVGWSDSKIQIYNIQKDGKLIQESSIINTGFGPWGMYFDQANNHIYISNFYSNIISILNIDHNDGSLKKANPTSVPTGAGITGLAFNPLDSRFLYAVNYEGNNIYKYEIDPISGTLQKQKIFIAGAAPRSIRIVNSHAYVTNQQSKNISMFEIDKTTGDLLPMQPATIGTGAGPIGTKVEISGKYFYIASFNENMIYMYEIQSNGLLKPLSTPKISSGVGPRGFVEDKYGHIYVSNLQDSSISMYQVESETGILRPMNPSKIATNSAIAMAITP